MVNLLEIENVDGFAHRVVPLISPYLGTLKILDDHLNVVFGLLLESTEVINLWHSPDHELTNLLIDLYL